MSFDKTEIYERRIAPLIDQITKMCVEENIAFLATFTTEQLEDGDVIHRTSAHFPAKDTPERLIHAAHKIIPEYINKEIVNGRIGIVSKGDK